MKKTIWEKRIPTLLGLLLITIGIGITSYLVKSGVIVIGQAAPVETPTSVRITNVSDTSFTVSYATEAKVLGSISYGKDDSFGKIALDDRDQQSGTINNYQLHHITIRNLEANTQYVFSITSGQSTFLNREQEDAPFKVKTASIINSPPPEQEPLVGKIITINASKPDEAILYVNTLNSQTLSVIVKSDGSYILPLNAMRNQDIASYTSIEDNTILRLLILGHNVKSSISILASQAKPVPLITLSKDYDFTTSNAPLAPSNQATSSASEIVSFPIFSVNPTTKQQAQILTPEEEEGFTDPQPQFNGTASPGASVKIIIHSDEQIETQVKADSKGTWTFRPDRPLTPGEHTISIVTTDQFGILKTITQTFTVYAAGTQVGLSGTPGALPTSFPTPTTKPSASQTPTPSLAISPTPQPFPTPTNTPTPLTPTPTLFVSPTSAPVELLPTGSTTIITGGLIAFATLTLGLVLFFVTRGHTPL